MPPDPTAAPAAETFPIRFSPVYRALALPFGITPARAWVRLDPEWFEARFGPWVVETPIANVAGAEVTGPYTLPKTAGPAHLSFADQGLTFAGNGDRGVCVRFHDPVPGISSLSVPRHPGLTVTVDDIEGFLRSLSRRIRRR